MNYCRSCKQDFTSVKLFDRHRVGKHEYDWSLDQSDGRRCLDVDEMITLGWMHAGNAWLDPVRVEAARKAFSGVPRRSETRSQRKDGRRAA